ncbi:uncharacterized protein LOC115720465 isoform X3 [Cannabis sativa]|nr:uncharacterized protein LOC115720465 isoform X3 [Cannabis sativa]
MEDDDDNTPVENETPSEDNTTKEKRFRGQSICKEIWKWKSKGLKVPLEWNDYGQPIGKHCAMLQTYLGYLARTQVPIDIVDWPSVPYTLLVHLWDDVEATFEVDPNYDKRYIMESISKKWRDRKSQLTKIIFSYLEDPEFAKDNPTTLTDPPKKSNITKEQWKTFVASRDNPEFKAIRKGAQERRAKLEYNHRSARTSLAQIEANLQKEHGTSEQIDRALIWKKSRMNNKGQFLDESTKEVAERIDELLEKKGKGEVVEIGSNDVLTQALGKPEHRGRVRGKGLSVCQREVFIKPPRTTFAQLQKQQLQFQQQEKQELLRQLKIMNERFSTIESQMKMMMSHRSQSQPEVQSGNGVEGQSGNGVEVQSGNRVEAQSGNGVEAQSGTRVEAQLGNGVEAQSGTRVEAQLGNGLEIHQSTNSKDEPCRLIIESSLETVAKGYIVHTGDDKIHCDDIRDNLRVRITEVIVGDADLPKAISDEVVKVKDAINTFVPWPSHLVLRGFEALIEPRPKKLKVTRKNNPSQHIQPTTQPQQKESRPFSSSSVKTSSLTTKKSTIPDHIPPSLVLYTKNFLKSKGSFMCTITAPQNIFGSIEHNIYIDKDDVSQVLHLEEISAAVISLYMRGLYETLLKMRIAQYVSFMEASQFAPSIGKTNNIVERARLLAERLNSVEKGMFLLTPYNLGRHWMVIIIYAHSQDAYFFDPVGNHPKEDAVSVVKSAFDLYNTRNNNLRRKVQGVTWYTVQGPKQPDDKVCGFYIMRLMRDLTMSNDPRDYLEKHCYGQKTYSMDEINEVREEWVSYLTEYMP